LYSRSPTAEILTSYAEGIHLKNHDCHDEYTVHSTEPLVWLVMRSSDLSCGTASDFVPKFVKPRIVRLRGNHMVCSCLEYSRRQHPCRHMTAVFASYKMLMQPHHFHLRWWSSFGYFFQNKDLNDGNIANQLSIALRHTRISCYAEGKYIGINISLHELTNLQQIQSAPESTSTLMIKLWDYTTRHSLVRQSSTHHSILTTNDFDDDDTGIITNSDDMGGLTRSVTVFSTQQTELSQIIESDRTNNLEQCQVISILKEKVYSLAPYVETREELKTVEDSLDTLIISLCKTKLTSEHDTFGYLGERKEIQRRSKYPFER